MRILAEVVVILVVLGIAGVLLASAMGRRRTAGERDEERWRVHTRTRGDGTLLVSVRRGDTDERVIRELPPGMEGIDFASEVQLAKDDAALAADELNRP